MTSNENIIASVRSLARQIADLTNGLSQSGEKVDERDFSKRSERVIHERDQKLIATIAEREYKNRQQRRAEFGCQIFGEPAWDMLLDMVVHYACQRRVSVSNACLASGAPATTALRWINYLEEEGLVTRIQCETDKRIAFLELSDAGWQKMARYLSSL